MRISMYSILQGPEKGPEERRSNINLTSRQGFVTHSKRRVAGRAYIKSNTCDVLGFCKSGKYLYNNTAAEIPPSESVGIKYY